MLLLLVASGCAPEPPTPPDVDYGWWLTVRASELEESVVLEVR